MACLADRNQALLVALARGAEHAELERRGRRSPTRHSSETRRPVAIEQFQHGAVAQAGRLGRCRGPRSIFSISSRFRNLGMVCHCRGVRRCSVGSLAICAFPQEEAVEAAERGEVAGDRAAAQSGLV